MSGPMVVRRLRDFVSVAGPDAADYLQGQLSQDVPAVEVGESAWTFVLQPTGKVDAWCRITRRDTTAFVIDVDGGHGEVLLARLRRFLLRTDCTVEPLAWTMVTRCGDGPAGPPPDGLAMVVDWPGLDATDLAGPTGGDWVDAFEPDGAEAWDAVRIPAGIPAMGSEIDDDTLPGATGQVERSVSFTKGCYTGLELVARVDSRAAGTPTHLVRIAGPGGPPVQGAEVTADGAPVATVTSAVAVADGFVALGYRRRSAVAVTAGRIGDAVVTLQEA